MVHPWRRPFSLKRLKELEDTYCDEDFLPIKKDYEIIDEVKILEFKIKDEEGFN